MTDDVAGEPFGGLSPEELAPWTVKRKYLPVFSDPEGEWRIDANWEDGYFWAAKRIVAAVLNPDHEVEHMAMPGIDGIAGVYLFRHYLELALKHILFHSRWLRDTSSNEHWSQIRDVAKTHRLQPLWDTIKTERLGKIDDGFWDSNDIGFVDACVADFDRIDPGGECFRYPGKVIGIGHAPAGAENLGISLERLFGQMQHVYDVLQSLDLYCLNSHGLNGAKRGVGTDPQLLLAQRIICLHSGDAPLVGAPRLSSVVRTDSTDRAIA
jgi:hypothetical protein